MFTQEMILFITVIAPLVAALSELFKRTDIVPVKWVPVFTFVMAIVVAILAVPFTDLDIVNRAWGGAIAGLSSMGLYELVTRTYNMATPDDKNKKGDL